VSRVAPWAQVFTTIVMGAGVHNHRHGRRCSQASSWAQVFTSIVLGAGVHKHRHGRRCSQPSSWAQVFTTIVMGAGVHNHRHASLGSSSPTTYDRAQLMVMGCVVSISAFSFIWRGLTQFTFDASTRSLVSRAKAILGTGMYAVMASATRSEVRRGLDCLLIS
jgi:hypothetical protein